MNEDGSLTRSEIEGLIAEAKTTQKPIKVWVVNSSNHWMIREIIHTSHFKENVLYYRGGPGRVTLNPDVRIWNNYWFFYSYQLKHELEPRED